MDPAVEESIQGTVGHAPPFETDSLDRITAIDVSHAHSLEGIEQLRLLRILIMNGCNVPAIKDSIAQLSRLSAIVSYDSALRDISGLPAQSLDRVDLQRNRIEDIEPLLSYPNLKEANLTGNPIDNDGYRNVIPELKRRGCRVIASEEREWELSLRISEAGLPFSYYRSRQGYRLCRPGQTHSRFPELNHPIIAPDELDVLLSKNPSSVALLFERNGT